MYIDTYTFRTEYISIFLDCEMVDLRKLSKPKTS